MTIALDRVDLGIDTSAYLEVKDPCPVYDGERWHLFGTGITGPHEFELLHATAPELRGPWQLLDPVDVAGIEGSCVAAPGAVVDDGTVHLFVQTDYNRHGGRIEHLVATDGDATDFEHRGTALGSARRVGEAGIYDPHPSLIDGRPHLVYSAFTTVGQPDIHLAVSASGGWDGPWQRRGPILEHEHVACHNQRGSRDYEWGLEGAQLVELPAGGVLMNAVCFVPGRVAGARQRVFFAMADRPTGPYDVVGPVLVPDGGDHAGENGHASAVVVDNTLALFFQERDVATRLWRYGLATIDVARLAGGTEEGRAA